MKSRIGILLVSFMIFQGVSANAYAVDVKGTFVATDQCEAYQSKKNKTNPGSVVTTVNTRYELKELNKAKNADWYRIEMPGAPVESKRWVYKACGNVENVEIQAGGSSVDCKKIRDNNPDCSVPGLADSYVLALSWQPAFCETHREKKECYCETHSHEKKCGEEIKHSYMANNFTLHGLWPNKEACAKCYGPCTGNFVAAKACSDVPISSHVLSILQGVMPAANTDSCLQKHEWNKHGLCEVPPNADKYFATAIRLHNEFNESGMATFMQEHRGQNVTTEEFIEALDSNLFPGAHERVVIVCNGGPSDLTDVYINLPVHLDESLSLVDLMKKVDSKFKDGCKGRFWVDELGR